MLKGIIKYAHHLIESSVLSGDTVIDATCGNGNDTLVLSRLVGSGGAVLAFDIQEQAINNTKELIKSHHCENVTVIHDSHASVTKYVPINEPETIGGAIFNLGYLPKSDKKVVTEGESTIKAVEAILSLLKKNRLIVLVIYHGHEGGKKEKNLILEYVKQLDQKKYHVAQYGFINQMNNPPFVIAIEKR